ncbi:histidine phosphatase family protein [Chitinasiproducens palmae]|uniref:Phosphoglycerate mutase n=1 Tax=Chitinasiproducens palmae TaxID=1770053 RepID=A0A1H2PPC3_9BURK|nr:histidine phosphatase family protein [Chitinasiproducens palmae]SDV48131.1 phosphoglycerate mutase [Chitinasiproducens palmae]
MNSKPSASDRATIVLVRHGETDWNRIKRIQGQLDIPLSALGRQQAEELARRFGADAAPLPGVSGPIVAVYSSDLSRASATAAPLAAALGLPVHTTPELRERNYGAFQGGDADSIAAQYPEDFARWRARDPAFAPIDGESQHAFSQRIVAALDRLAGLHAGHAIVCVAHGGVLDCAYRHASGMPLDAERTHLLLNTSVNVLDWDVRQPRVVAWADVAHLGDLRTEDDSLRRFS